MGNICNLMSERKSSTKFWAATIFIRHDNFMNGTLVLAGCPVQRSIRITLFLTERPVQTPLWSISSKNIDGVFSAEWCCNGGSDVAWTCCGRTSVLMDIIDVTSTKIYSICLIRRIIWKSRRRNVTICIIVQLSDASKDTSWMRHYRDMNPCRMHQKFLFNPAETRLCSTSILNGSVTLTTWSLWAAQR